MRAAVAATHIICAIFSDISIRGADNYAGIAEAIKIELGGTDSKAMV